MAAPKYFLTWSDSEYADDYHEEFDTEKEAFDFINSRLAVGAPLCRFELIRGVEIEIVPVEIVKTYGPKR